MYFNSVSITVLACISVSITVIVNGFDLFQLTDISVSVSVNGYNAELNEYVNQPMKYIIM